jgi:hypothetical protein
LGRDGWAGALQKKREDAEKPATSIVGLKKNSSTALKKTLQFTRDTAIRICKEQPDNNTAEVGEQP